MANGRRRGGGGPGPRAPVGKISHMAVSGDPKGFQVEVRVTAGQNQPLANAIVRLRLGTAENPFGSWVPDPNDPNQKFELVTDADGWAITPPWDYSHLVPSTYTHITAICGAAVESRPISESGKIITAQAPKPKPRMKVAPETEVIESYDNKYRLTFRTFAADGKTGESASVEFESDVAVTLRDAVTGTIIAANVKFHTLTTNPSGILRLEVEVHGFATNVTLRHGQSLEEVKKQLEMR